MQILYTPSPKKQVLAQTLFIEHENGTSYPKLAKKYGFHRNYIMSLVHWYKDFGIK